MRDDVLCFEGTEGRKQKRVTVYGRIFPARSCPRSQHLCVPTENSPRDFAEDPESDIHGFGETASRLFAVVEPPMIAPGMTTAKQIFPRRVLVRLARISEADRAELRDLRLDHTRLGFAYLGHRNINFLGQYSFWLADAVAQGELRPLRDPTEDPYEHGELALA